MRWLLLSICIVLLPGGSVAAQVVISEVAWMGSTGSANAEWIELHNTSDATVDATGWQLTDGANLTILLDGLIAAGSYVVLERTSDAAAPGAAWQIYTGALVNTGATLTLTDATNNQVDVIRGGENWESIGGDNTTKETAQRSDTGWITASPTPGARNSTVAASAQRTTVTTKPSSGAKPLSAAKVTSKSIPLVIPDNELTLLVVAPTDTYVNQPVTISVASAGLGKTWLDSLQYQWNFGDGYTMNGKEVQHTFAYPGTYVVTVYGSYNRYEAVGRFEITVLPVVVSLATGKRGEILLHNDSPYEVNISQYTVKAGFDSFTFPAHSYILARQSVVVPGVEGVYASVFDAKHIQLATLYPNLESAQSFPIATAETSAPVESAISAPAAVILAESDTANLTTSTSEQRFTFITSVTTSTPTTTTQIVAAPKQFTTTTAPVAPEEEVVPQVATVTQSNSKWHDWWLGVLIMLLAVSIFAVYTRPTNS